MEFATGPSEQQIETNKRSVNNWGTKTWNSKIPGVFQFLRFEDRFEKLQDALAKTRRFPILALLKSTSARMVTWVTLAWPGLFCGCYNRLQKIKYLVGLSLRISGYTTHSLLALNIALGFVLKHLAVFYYNKHRTNSIKKRQRNYYYAIYLLLMWTRRACVTCLFLPRQRKKCKLRFTTL